MKIDRSRLTPIYDQYSNQENRLTHALLHTIGSSTIILNRFLREVIGIKGSIVSQTFEVSTQKVPFSHGDDKPEKIDSVPDAWIISQNNAIGALIEVKDIKDSVRLGQLRKHLKRLANYQGKYLFVLTPDFHMPAKVLQLQNESPATQHISWTSWGELYRWFQTLKSISAFNKPLESYLIDAFLQYLERRWEILGFQGIVFNAGFDANKAKLILNDEMDALHGFVIKQFPKLTCRRPAITTFRKDAVWDCFGVNDKFTHDIHITISIHETYQDISLTIPNAANKRWTRLKRVFSEIELENKMFPMIIKLRKDTPSVFMEFTQRHFHAVKKGIQDAYLEFSMDTFGEPFKKPGSKIKEFPLWYEVLKEAIVKKKGINGQVAIKCRFYFESTKNIKSVTFLKTAKKTLAAMKPLYHFLMTSRL